jgi:hypothetical protein
MDEIEIGDGRDADVLVCAHVTEPLYLPDNIVGQCNRCLRLVQYRPHAPKEPTRLCVDCAGPSVLAARSRGLDVKLIATETTVTEVRDWMKAHLKEPKP